MKTFHLKFKLYIAFSMLLLISSSSNAFAPPLSDTIRLSDFMSHCICEKYAGPLKEYVSDSISIYETEQTKMYFFRKDFWAVLSDSQLADIDYRNMNYILQDLFSKRLLTGNMFFASYGKTIGNRDSIQILGITNITKKLFVRGQKRYRLLEIRANNVFFREQHQIFLLLLYNPDADSHTSIEDFIEGCDMKCFTYYYTEI